LKRPAWAETAAFANCWSHLEMVAKLGSTYPGQCLRALAEARVIKIDRDQIDALPLDLEVLKEDEGGRKFLDYRTLKSRWLAVKNPFPVTFLDLSEAQIPMFLNDTLATAALLIDPSELGRFDLEPSSTPAAPLVLPFLHYPEGRPGEPIGIGVFPDPDGEGITGLDLDTWELHGEDRFRKVLEDGVALSERAVTCMAWLMSYNIELVEAPLSPRQRKRELAKGREIALTVHVKQTKRGPTASGSDARANYSHRFETRGHFRHLFELKPDGSPSKTYAACLRKDPSRLLEVAGKPCFRFWVPPFVKGPSDKPFVPKIRLAGEDAEAANQPTPGNQPD
jgi:hypothetical protein